LILLFDSLAFFWLVGKRDCTSSPHNSNHLIVFTPKTQRFTIRFISIFGVRYFWALCRRCPASGLNAAPSFRHHHHIVPRHAEILNCTHVSPPCRVAQLACFPPLSQLFPMLSQLFSSIIRGSECREGGGMQRMVNFPTCCTTTTPALPRILGYQKYQKSPRPKLFLLQDDDDDDFPLARG
jgi:hypothetical protein